MLSILNKDTLLSDNYHRDSVVDRNWFKPSTFGINYSTGKNGEYVADVQMSGMEEKDISIEKAGNMINVIGKRQDHDGYYVIKKSFSVPDMYDIDNASIKLKDGTLTFNMPQLAEKRIEGNQRERRQ